MSTWRELSLGSLQAAQKLLSDGHWRSCVSRSYYAAYCAVTDQLVDRGVQFAHSWKNPSPDQLPTLIQSTLPLPLSARRQLTRAIRRLRAAREDADYRRGVAVDRVLALACVQDAVFVTQALEKFL